VAGLEKRLRERAGSAAFSGCFIGLIVSFEVVELDRPSLEAYVYTTEDNVGPWSSLLVDCIVGFLVEC
jgi:hypothetical protein